MVDHLFFLAVAALGWGLSLVSYRPLAVAGRWPLGKVQATAPVLAVALGAYSIFVGVLAAMARGPSTGGLVIILFGVALAVFWTGFLRVGAQSALILAPAAATGLLVSPLLSAFFG